MIQLIKDYANLCRDENKLPKKIILTFTPCGRRKTMEFIKWLGMQVPQEAEDRIFAASEAESPAPAPSGGCKKAKPPVELSCELLCDNLRRILAETAGCGVPLGLNVESVSGFKDEIDATHDLFRSLQAILLDSTGSPWVMRWSRLDHVLSKRTSVDQRRSLDRRKQSLEYFRQTVHKANASTKRQTSPLQLALLVAASIGFGALLPRTK